jgi:hypothetical protein
MDQSTSVMTSGRATPSGLKKICALTHTFFTRVRCVATEQQCEPDVRLGGVLCARHGRQACDSQSVDCEQCTLRAPPLSLSLSILSSLLLALCLTL